MKDITYILGAGASYQSMPLVNSFVNRFHVYINFLRGTMAHNNNFIDENLLFISNIEGHLSFDTFFKKLFHQNSTEEIVKYKSLLLYYFIFEHLCPIELYNNPYGWEILKEQKKYKNDPRFDSLIAGLLKPIQGQCEFYTNVNLITWNYDLNLLGAVRNFMFFSQSIGDVINRYQIEKNVFLFKKQLKVIHLNGFVKHEAFNDANELNQDGLIKLFEKLIRNYNASHDDLQSDIKKISFAWENMGGTNSEPPSFIKTSQQAIRDSDSIIIIGYSFPLYNRLFDQIILSMDNIQGKKIFLRDPRYLEIQEVLFSDFGVPRNQIESYDGTPELNSSNSCDSFFVPNQIYR